MQVVVGKLAGFCGGVKRSVIKAKECLDKNDVVYCYGEIVHNKQVINSLENEGLKIIDNIEEVPDNNIVVFRAHGVEKTIYEKAENKNLEIVDLTCPKVLKIHEDAKELVNNGYFIILIAQISHPETIGTISFCGKDSFILEDEVMLDDLMNKIKESGKKKVAVLSQTTFSVSKFNDLVMKLDDLLKDYELDINNNICDATDLRQKEMKELAPQVDAMIVIGGKNSSNTKKLYEIGLKECKKCYLVETIDDLKADFENCEKVGVMAGASTPQSSIDDVVNYLNSNNL